MEACKKKRKRKNPIYENKIQVAKNIKTIRHYLELNKSEFAEKTGLGKRATEFESGRLLPSKEEIQKISDLSEIPVDQIIFFRLCTRMDVY